MSRIESGKVIIKKDIISSQEFLRGINTICLEQASSKGVSYDWVITGFVKDYYIGDAMKLQQILVNLIANAVKFTPGGGKFQFIVSMRFTRNNMQQVV